METVTYDVEALEQRRVGVKVQLRCEWNGIKYRVWCPNLKGIDVTCKDKDKCFYWARHYLCALVNDYKNKNQPIPWKDVGKPPAHIETKYLGVS